MKWQNLSNVVISLLSNILVFDNTLKVKSGLKINPKDVLAKANWFIFIFSFGYSLFKSIYSKQFKDWIIKKSKISSVKFGFKLSICKVNNNPYIFEVS